MKVTPTARRRQLQARVRRRAFHGCSSAPRAPRKARPTSPSEACGQPPQPKGVRGAPDPQRSLGGGARRTAGRSRVWALGAPLNHLPKELTEECLWGGSAPPNGSRLSCGRNDCGRKAVEPQTQRLASEATQFLPTCERPAASSAC